VGRAFLVFNYDIEAPGSHGHLNGVSQGIDALDNLRSGIIIKDEIFESH
jgi:hypothetical protein